MDVEDEILKCIAGLGGEKVSNSVGESPNFENADFIFKEQKVVSELKSLEENKILDERIIQKASNLYMEELASGKAPVVLFGTRIMTTRGFSDKFTRKIIDLYKKPIQSIVKKANRQIKETKKALNIPDFKGLLIIANNNHKALDPWHANYILNQILGKPDYSSINAAVYLSADQTAIGQESKKELGVWIARHRTQTHEISNDFLEKFRVAWFEHYTNLRGEKNHFQFQVNESQLASLENKKA
jgi:hypothetical protein